MVLVVVTLFSNNSAYFLVSRDLADTTALRLFVRKRNGNVAWGWTALHNGPRMHGALMHIGGRRCHWPAMLE
jgi:hypothetical protein